jgi:hypothetical protein
MLGKISTYRTIVYILFIEFCYNTEAQSQTLYLKQSYTLINQFLINEWNNKEDRPKLRFKTYVQVSLVKIREKTTYIRLQCSPILLWVRSECFHHAIRTARIIQNTKLQRTHVGREIFYVQLLPVWPMKCKEWLPQIWTQLHSKRSTVGNINQTLLQSCFCFR